MKDVDEVVCHMDPLDPADGLSDEDGDGLTFAWEYYLGTSTTLADSDGDGWSDSEELLLFNTNPLDAASHPRKQLRHPAANLPQASPPPPAPTITNGDFSSLAVTKWTKNTNKNYQGGDFQYGTVQTTDQTSGWSAYVGNSIEVWKPGVAKGGKSATDQFVELDGSASGYGIKQQIQNVKAGNYLLAWDQCGRTNLAAESDQYVVKVYYKNAAQQVVPVASSAEIKGFDKAHWTQKIFAFQITDVQISTSNHSPFYIAFIPLPKINGYGTLIDNVNLLPVDLAVDNNRDGDLVLGSTDDQTTAAKPYRFWLNNDHDNYGNPQDTYNAADDHPWTTQALDNANDKIESERDVEDFARLHLKIETP